MFSSRKSPTILTKVVFLGLILFSTQGLLSAQNGEKPVPVDSPVYRWLDLLYNEAGLAMPSRSGPFTASQVEYYLGMVEAKTDLRSESFVRNLHAIEEALKPKVLAQEKTADGKTFSLGIEQSFNPELYLNLGDTTVPWLYNYNDRPALYQVTMETWVLDNLYGGFDMEYKKGPVVDNVQQQPVTNLFTDIGMEDFQWPYWAGLLAGGDHWDFRFFRSAMNWGPGSTNMVLSPDAGVVDNIMFSTWWSGFTYSLLWVPMDDYAVDPSSFGAGSYGIAGSEQEQGSKNLIIHRVTAHPLPNWTFSASELMVYEGVFDIRFLSPVFIDHNWFIQAKSNIDASLDFEGAIFPGWVIYGEWYLDYIRTWFKTAEGDQTPGAFGYMLGSRNSFSIGNLDATIQIEGVYTDPYMYLNNNLNMLHTWRFQSNWNGSQYQSARIFVTPFGFGLGPDTIWIDPLFRLEKIGEWKAEISFPLTIQGTTNIYTENPLIPGSPYHDEPDLYLNFHTPVGTAQITQEISLAGEITEKCFPFTIPWSSSLGLQIAGLAIWNKDNAAAGVDFAVQSALTWKNSF